MNEEQTARHEVIMREVSGANTSQTAKRILDLETRVARYRKLAGVLYAMVIEPEPGTAAANFDGILDRIERIFEGEARPFEAPALAPSIVREFDGKSHRRAAQTFAQVLSGIAVEAMFVGAKLVELGYQAPPDPEDFPSLLRAVKSALDELVKLREGAPAPGDVEGRSLYRDERVSLKTRDQEGTPRTMADLVRLVGAWWRGHTDLGQELSKVPPRESAENREDRARRRAYQDGKAHGIGHVLDILRELEGEGFELTRRGAVEADELVAHLSRLSFGSSPVTALVAKLPAWRDELAAHLDARDEVPSMAPVDLARALRWAVVGAVDVIAAPLAGAGALTRAEQRQEGAEAILGDALGDLAREVVAAAARMAAPRRCIAASSASEE